MALQFLAADTAGSFQLGLQLVAVKSHPFRFGIGGN